MNLKKRNHTSSIRRTFLRMICENPRHPNLYCEEQAARRRRLGYQTPHASRVSRPGPVRRRADLPAATLPDPDNGRGAFTRRPEPGRPATDPRPASGGRPVRIRELPFSQQNESEADHIGLQLMLAAGYEPAEAPKFWDRM